MEKIKIPTTIQDNRYVIIRWQISQSDLFSRDNQSGFHFYQLSSLCFSNMQNWVDGIRKAQDLYANAKMAPIATIDPVTRAGSISRQPSSCYYEDDDPIDPTDFQSCASYGNSAGLIPSRSPRGGSSRGSRGSSLVHSHR